MRERVDIELERWQQAEEWARDNHRAVLDAEFEPKAMFNEDIPLRKIYAGHVYHTLYLSQHPNNLIDDRRWATLEKSMVSWHDFISDAMFPRIQTFTDRLHHLVFFYSSSRVILYGDDGFYIARSQAQGETVPVVDEANTPLFARPKDQYAVNRALGLSYPDVVSDARIRRIQIEYSTDTGWRDAEWSGFDDVITDYAVDVPRQGNQLRISVLPRGTHSVVTINNAEVTPKKPFVWNLIFGTTIFDLDSVSQDGTESVSYTFSVLKAEGN